MVGRARTTFPSSVLFHKHSLLCLLSRCGYKIIKCYRSAIGNPRNAVERVGYANKDKNLALSLVAPIVAGINLFDIAFAHGGLLTVIARSK